MLTTEAVWKLLRASQTTELRLELGGASLGSLAGCRLFPSACLGSHTTGSLLVYPSRVFLMGPKISL